MSPNSTCSMMIAVAIKVAITIMITVWVQTEHMTDHLRFDSKFQLKLKEIFFKPSPVPIMERGKPNRIYSLYLLCCSFVSTVVEWTLFPSIALLTRISPSLPSIAPSHLLPMQFVDLENISSPMAGPFGDSETISFIGQMRCKQTTW